MNKIILIILLLVSLNTQAQTENFWVKKSDFGSNMIGNGLKRERAVAFSIDNYGYVGTGVDTAEMVLNDFWKFDPILNAWSQIATLPGSVRRNATAFSINDKGYVGTGINTVNSSDFGSMRLNDLWEYSPTSNSWVEKASYPGASGIYFVTAFSTNTKGYLCGGKLGANFYTNQLWEYNPNTDSWTQKLNFPGGVRYQMSSFTIDGKGYVGLGVDNDLYRDDIYEFDPSTSQWTQKAPLPGSARGGAVAFSLGQRGFICMGTNGGLLGDLWQYNPFSNDWSVKANYDGSSRKNAVAFIAYNKAYVGTGKGNSGKKSSFYQYIPSSILGIHEFDNELSIYPNPVQEQLHLKNIPISVKRIKIIAMDGSVVINTANSSHIDVTSISTGIYQLIAEDALGTPISSLKLNKL